VAYPALVHDVADGDNQEPWFALITALRNAGLAIGAGGASLAVALGGANGYTAIVAINAVSYAVAGILIRLDSSGSGHATRIDDTAEEAAAGSWSGALRDRPFLGYVVLNIGFALLSLAFVVAVPVFLVRAVQLSQWMPGSILAVNAILGAIGATPIVATITGRRRDRTLVTSQAMIGVGFVAVLCCAYVPLAVSVCLALVAVVLVTTTELIQGLIVPSIVNECATGASRGRYNSLYQMAFSVGDIITPGLMTMLLAHGAVATWLPLVVLAGLNMCGIPLLARRLPAMRRWTGRPPITEPTISRLIEADDI
jgi:hypothetical protein